jgi:dTDP-glucose 4,6-dehydratase
MKSKLLITGADGFIGSHLTELAIKTGYSVRAGVQYNSFGNCGWLDFLDSAITNEIEIVPFDIRDSDSVDSLLQGVDLVINLAALVAIPHSYSSPRSYIDTNLIGTLNVLKAAQKHDVMQVVQTSTSEVYGTAQYVPIDELHPIVAQSPYAASKASADQLALSFYHSFNLPVSIARPFNTFGPRQSMRAVIPAVIGQLASGRSTVQLGSTHPTRDFTYVLDTAKAFLAILGKENCLGETINFGSGFEISIADTVSVISRLMGRNVEVSKDAERVRPEGSEVNRLFADNTKAHHLLGWQPENPGLEGFTKNLESTINWFSDPKNLAKYKTDIYSK